MVTSVKPILNSSKIKLFLASASPRRKELLSLLGMPFEVLIPDILEQRLQDESAAAYVERNALEKANAVIQTQQVSSMLEASAQSSIIISADTIVIHEQEILEKPKSREEAYAMLMTLSGSEHQVITGFCVAYMGSNHKVIFDVETVTTQVIFSPISKTELEWYLDTDEPFDKAGGYGIQGYGGLWVQEIKGSYSNVVGLPMTQLRSKIWKAFKVIDGKV